MKSESEARLWISNSSQSDQEQAKVFALIARCKSGAEGHSSQLDIELDHYCDEFFHFAQYHFPHLHSGRFRAGYELMVVYLNADKRCMPHIIIAAGKERKRQGKKQQRAFNEAENRAVKL